MLADCHWLGRRSLPTGQEGQWRGKLAGAPHAAFACGDFELSSGRGFCEVTKTDQVSFSSGKSRAYRFGSSVIKRSACTMACDPMMKSAGKRFAPRPADLRRRFA